MDGFPIRLVSPIQIPGAPAMKVRFSPGQEFIYNVGALTENAIYTSPPIDIGPPERRTATLVIAHKIGESGAGQVLAIQSSYDDVNWHNMPLANGSQSFAWNDNPWVDLVTQARPMFRKVRVYYKNGVNAQTNLKIHVTIMSGV